MQRFFLVLFLAGISRSIATAQTHYVRHNATGMNNGATWYDAFTNLHDALQQAQYGDTIWVAGGSYIPSDTTSRDATFTLKNGVRLFGGFSGAETQLNQRNLQLHATILSGDAGTAGNTDDNCYNVLTCHHADSTTVIDGFIIEGGNANSTTPSDPLSRKRGGGMYLKPLVTGQDASPQIRHCIFRNNNAVGGGSALFADGNTKGASAPDMIFCRLEQNTGSQTLYYFLNHPENRQNITIKHCTWVNSATVDVLMTHLRGKAQVLIENDTISNSYGSNIIFAGTGGADTTILTISQSLFQHNTEGYIQIFPSSSSIGNQIHIYNNQFIDNQSFEIYSDAHYKLSNSDIAQNHFSHTEAIILNLNYFQHFDQNDFRDISTAEIHFLDVASCSNNSFDHIPSLYWSLFNYSDSDTSIIVQNSFYKTGMNISFPSARFRHCSFIDILPHQYFDTACILKPYQYLDLNSCVFSGYASEHPLIDTIESSGPWVRAVNCVFESPCEGVIFGLDSLVCNGSNVFGVAPMFYDTAGGDFRLLPCSPGINMGNASTGINTDITGAPRIANGLPDAGAYESTLSIRRDTLLSASCNNADGAVVYHDEACLSLQYQWVNNTGSTGTQAAALAPGTYYMTVTGQYELMLTDTITIGGSTAVFELDTDLTPSSSAGADDGAIVINGVSGGATPYQYVWSTGATGEYVELLPPGHYSLTVTDANACTGVFSFLLEVSSTAGASPAQIKAFPNPIFAGNALRVEGLSIRQYALTDLSGRIIIRDNNAHEILVPSTTPPGIYLLLVTDSNSGHTYRNKLWIMQAER